MTDSPPLKDRFAGCLLRRRCVADEIVKRTDGVSAAFIKELMRRIAQFGIERDADDQITHRDVDGVLEEMLFKGGSLNLSILGAGEQVSAAV